MVIDKNHTTVAVTEATRARLAALKGYGDAYEHVIVRLLEFYGHLDEANKRVAELRRIEKE